MEDLALNSFVMRHVFGADFVPVMGIFFLSSIRRY